MKQKWNKQVKSRVMLATIFAFLVSLCIVWGYLLNNNNTVFGKGIIYIFVFALCWIMLGLACYGIMFLLDKKNDSHGKSMDSIPTENDITPLKKNISLCDKLINPIIIAALILILWLPSFLIVYPGWFNYDALWQLSMYISGDISSHHPVLHTLLMGGIIEEFHQFRVAHGDWDYNYNISIALYCLIQMALSAMGFGYVISKVANGIFGNSINAKCSRKKFAYYIFIGIVIAFFGLYPPIVLLVMSPTKDVLFGVCLMIFMAQTYELISCGHSFLPSWVVMMFLCLVLRQNSLYVLIPISFVVVIINGRKYGKKSFVSLLVSTLIVVTLHVLYTGPFYSALGVIPGSRAEFLSVPSQQIVNVYCKYNDELTSEQKELIEDIFDESAFSDYRPKLADATKGAIDMDVFDARKSEVISLYIDLCKEYPKDFWDSFVILNYGFWYPDAVLDLYEDGETLFFAANYSLPAIKSSKLPGLLPFYETFQTGFPVQDGGLLTWLLMPALSAYLLLFTFLYSIHRRSTSGIWVSAIGLFIWFTFLLGPCVSIRYVFYLYCMIPLNVRMLLKNENDL